MPLSPSLARRAVLGGLAAGTVAVAVAAPAVTRGNDGVVRRSGPDRPEPDPTGPALPEADGTPPARPGARTRHNVVVISIDDLG